MAAKIYKTADGKRVPSVSTIQKMMGGGGGGLIYWANQEGLAGRTLDEARTEATGVGTIVHAMADTHWKGGEMPDLSKLPAEMRTKVEIAYGAYLEWHEANVAEVIGSEEQVISERHRFGGTLDRRYINHQSKRVLCDFKAANGMYPDNAVQLAGYDIALVEQEEWQPDRYQIVRLGKENGNFTVATWDSAAMQPGRDAFLLCRRLYDLQKPLKGLVS